MSTFALPKRIQNYSGTTTDDIFIDSSRKDHIFIEPVISGLSDHGVLLLVIKNIESISNYHNYRQQIWLIKNETIKEFITHLSNANWDSVSNSRYIDSKYSTFLNIVLTVLEASFPTKTEKITYHWITEGMKTSCKHKQDLCLNCQSSNNQIIKIHYRKYCRILTQVIKRLNVCFTINRY
jgi:hypothetical protein